MYFSPLQENNFIFLINSYFALSYLYDIDNKLIPFSTKPAPEQAKRAF